MGGRTLTRICFPTSVSVRDLSSLIDRPPTTDIAPMREIIHRGRKIQVAVDTSIGPNGEVIRRDMILHPGAVVILPVVDADHICLLRNYRFVIGETLWELPAGTLEPGEPQEKAAA